MRVVSVVALWMAALLLAACDTTDSRYFSYGIGTDLYSADIVQTTQYQDIYLTELCRQALPVVASVEGQCPPGVASSGVWNLIVQAGLNDVDRRCDSYLAWLDDRRRTNNAVLKELGDVAVAAQAIMRVAGASANPITLAGLAFGLASNTFTNVNSRLLLEVDKTTVQTLVLRRRNDYRFQLNGIRIDNRPAAVHALRSYLNICTPFTIETDINATVTVFQTSGPDALKRPPLIDAATINTAIVESAGAPLKPRKPIDPVINKKAFIANVQSALCAPSVSGTMDDTTATAIQDFLRSRKLPPAVTPVDPTSADLRPKLQAAIDDVGDCKAVGFANAFEVGRYGVPGNKTKSRIEFLQKKMAGYLALNSSTVAVPVSGQFDAQTRTAIREIRRILKTTDSDQLDSSVVAQILAAT